ncbi:hypothetical protein NUSPORA_01971 [Nucleospora cyclopteri]
MFFVKTFTHTISFSPQFLGPDIYSLVTQYLVNEVEAKSTPFGFTISVLKINQMSDGEILLDGHIKFFVKYEALILNPIKGEVVDAPIVSQNKMGYFASIGPLSIFISTHQVPSQLLTKLSTNTAVRLKIIGTKIDALKVYAIGTLNDDCLGVIG